jgi:glucokinase
MAAELLGLLERANLPLSAVGGVGVVTPGPIDASAGVVLFAPNLPGWHNVPVCEILSAETGLPVTLANDASAAALGEAVYGAGKPYRHLVHFTVGTGIGGGIVIDRRLYTGAGGLAGEFGHIVVDPGGPPCGCGNYGCLEAFSSGSAMERYARLLARSRRSTRLATILESSESFGAGDISRAAEEGDEAAAEIIERAGRYLGIGIANMINIFDPDAVTISGGLLKAGAPYLQAARSEVRRLAFRQPPLLETTLGDDTGVLGAAAVAAARFS